MISNNVRIGLKKEQYRGRIGNAYSKHIRTRIDYSSDKFTAAEISTIARTKIKDLATQTADVNSKIHDELVGNFALG